MTEGYSARVRDHFENPRHVGVLDQPDGIGDVENPVSGASLLLHLNISGNIIRQAFFKAQGCAATIACGSVLTELLKDKSIDEAKLLSREDVQNALDGLPPTRKHAADLAIDAVRSALADFACRVSTL